jgi:RNA polymerase sigma factor (sigma-70 family)
MSVPSSTAQRTRQTSLPPFETLIERYGKPLLRFCVARLGPDRGEDVFQETLLGALASYDQLRNPDSARSWLFSIAHSKIVDAARRRSREPATADHEPADNRTVSRPDTGIWEEVKTLPPKQREAVGLRFLGDLTHAEIGEVMGTSTEAARRNVYEGLNQLRRRIDTSSAPNAR